LKTNYWFHSSQNTNKKRSAFSTRTSYSSKPEWYTVWLSYCCWKSLNKIFSYGSTSVTVIRALPFVATSTSTKTRSYAPLGTTVAFTLIPKAPFRRDWSRVLKTRIFDQLIPSLSIVISSTSLGGFSQYCPEMVVLCLAMMNVSSWFVKNYRLYSPMTAPFFVRIKLNFSVLLFGWDMPTSLENNIVFKTKSMVIYRYEILNRTVCICDLIKLYEE